jgi:Ca-activated chloride channel family protein
MIQLANPYLLLLLPLPWIIRRLLKPARPATPLALKIPFFTALQKLTHNTTWQHKFSWRSSLIYVVWALCVIAASGPQQIGDPVELPRSGRNIMLAIDLSGSMSLPDFTLSGQRSTRLDVVKDVAGRFIAGRKGDRIGLVVFASEAYARTPLTYDIATVKQALDNTFIGLSGQMTAIGDAIALSVKRLQQLPDNNRVLILLTDGANNAGELSPEQATQIAAEENIRIYTIAIGSEHYSVANSFINDDDLDEAILQSIAEATGGAFFRAKDTQSLEAIYAKIDALVPSTTDTQVFRPHKELYYWPLAAALLCMMLLSLQHIRGGIRLKHEVA